MLVKYFLFSQYISSVFLKIPQTKRYPDGIRNRIAGLACKFAKCECGMRKFMKHAECGCGEQILQIVECEMRIAEFRPALLRINKVTIPSNYLQFIYLTGKTLFVSRV